MTETKNLNIGPDKMQSVRKSCSVVDFTPLTQEKIRYMDINDFAANPIIDELLWVRETYGAVIRIIPEINNLDECKIMFIGKNSFEHAITLEAGFFNECWCDATNVLAQEGLIEVLRDLTIDERKILLPAEREFYRQQEIRQMEDQKRLSHARLARAIEEAREAFRLKQYARVVVTLSEYEQVLEGSNRRKLWYARKKIHTD